MLARILAVVTRPPIPVVLGLIAAVALIWFGGGLLYPHVGWPSLTLRLVLCVLVVVLGAGALVLRRMRARQKARAIENEIRAQAQTQITMVRPDRQSEIAELQQRFDEALESLKTSKLGRGALYAMPWYVIIGPPGSGKTTAITESGLNFPTFKGPQQKRGIRGLGGTRNCDWWFTDQAILLDTAGRYTTEAEDRDEWFAFLGMIKKARKLKPINGVMVALSIADVLAADEAGLEKHAETIRQRIDELVKQLEVVFPVYLVFTKCDLLDGFVEFFGALAKEGRGQVWGATFDSGQKPEGEAMHERFAREFDLLCRQAEAERNRLLVADRPARQQKKLFSLPLQLRAARRKLVEFARLLTQPNPYSEASDLRGFYLTSGTQEGAPIDIVLQSMQKAFGVQPQAERDGAEHVEAKSYFIRDLFSKVMFADRELAHSSARVMKRREWIRRGVIAGSAVALLVLGVNAVLRYRETRQLLHQASVAIATAGQQRIDPRRQGAPADVATQCLKELRERYLALLDAYSPTSVLGPSWDPVAFAMGHYADGLRDAFLQPAKDYVERRLRDYAGSEPKSAERGREDYTTYSQFLSFYRALDRAFFVADGPLNKAIAEQNLWKWSPQDLGQRGDSAATSDESRHLAAYIAAPRGEDCWVLGNDKALIAAVEKRLQSSGELDLAIRTVLEKNESLRQAEDSDLKKQGLALLAEQAGPTTPVPKEIVETKILDQRKQILMERVAAIGLAQTGSLDDISRSLADLDKADSPLMVTLRQSLEALRRGGALPLPGLGSDPIADAYAKSLTELAGLRKPVDELINGRGPGQRVLPDVLDKQEKVMAFGAKLTDVRAAIKRNLGEIKSASGLTMEPIEKSIGDMMDSVVGGIARELRAEMQDHWQRSVGSELAAVVQRFPFRRDLAADDVTAALFQELFRPDGRIDAELAVLAKVQRLKDFGRKLESGDRFVTCIERVRAIQAACFDPPPARGPGRLQFHIATMTMGKDFSDLALTIATGQSVRKSDGSPSFIEKPVRPWTIGDQGAQLEMKLTLVENGQPVRLTVPEPGDSRTQASQWGLLRVLAAAEPTVSAEAVRFAWTKKHAPANETEARPYTASVSLRPEGRDNPFDPGFFVLQPPEKIFKADQGP